MSISWMAAQIVGMSSPPRTAILYSPATHAADTTLISAIAAAIALLSLSIVTLPK